MVEVRAAGGRAGFAWTLAVLALVAGLSFAAALLTRWLPIWRLTLPPTVEAQALAPYKHVRLASEGRALTIGGDSAPAGLYFRFPLDASKRYLVSVSGRVLAGAPSLRLQIDDSAPQWWQAPAGTRTHVVGGGGHLEALIYSDAPFAYGLDAFSVRECAECRSDEDLKARILVDQPGLAPLLLTDRLAAAQQILNWASPRIAFALSANTDALGYAEVSDVSAADAYYRLFATSRSGVYCSGAAVFMARLLQLFGFDAVTIDFGIRGTVLTHVTVVVALPGTAGTDFYFADPTFNAMFKLHSGRFATIGDLVSARRTSRFDQVEMVEGTLGSRDWVCAEPGGSSPCAADPRCETRMQAEPGRSICRRPSFNYHAYTDLFARELRQAGVAHDSSAYVELLEGGVFSVGDFAQPGTTLAFAELLKSLAIPVGANATAPLAHTTAALR